MTPEAAGGLWARSKAPGAERTRGQGWCEGGRGVGLTATVSGSALVWEAAVYLPEINFFS